MHPIYDTLIHDFNESVGLDLQYCDELQTMYALLDDNKHDDDTVTPQFPVHEMSERYPKKPASGASRRKRA